MSHDIWLENYKNTVPFDDEKYQANHKEEMNKLKEEKIKQQTKNDQITRCGTEFTLISNQCSVHKITHRFDEKSLKILDCDNKSLNEIQFGQEDVSYQILPPTSWSADLQEAKIVSMGIYYSKRNSPKEYASDQLTRDIIANKKPRNTTGRIALGMFYFMKFFYPDFINTADYIVPIPNYDQDKLGSAVSITDALSNLTKKNSIQQTPFMNMLKKNFTEKMKNMYRSQRKKFYEEHTDAFVVADGADIIGKNILLVDDIITTASTMRFCKNKLEEKGANVSAISAGLTL